MLKPLKLLNHGLGQADPDKKLTNEDMQHKYAIHVICIKKKLQAMSADSMANKLLSSNALVINSCKTSPDQIILLSYGDIIIVPYSTVYKLIC